VAPPNFIANFDSASAMALSTARFLRGEGFPSLGQPTAMKPLAKRANVLPKRAREKVYIASGAFETVSPRRLHKLQLDDVATWLADEYPPGPYPVIAVGSSNGALVHLYAAMGIPWLPQTLLIPVRQRVHPDDPGEALELGREPGQRLVEAFPDLQLHHMHDANQDRLMVRALTYFRVKRRTLGAGYERFLRERLQPGGTILVIDCQRTWSTTRIGERHVFQHGALGGATEEEFHHGSERVAEYLDRYDSPVRQWDGPEPDGTSPEAEWGFEPALLDDIERFASERGCRVKRIAFSEPEDPSPFVADLYREWYARRHIPSNRLIVSSFVLMDPYWTLKTGSVPYWMEFNMEPSLRGLEDYLEKVPQYDEIHLMLFQHGVDAVGLPSGDEWASVFRHARVHGGTLGGDLEEFPLDFPQYARYDDAIKSRIPARHPLPTPLTLGEVEDFLERSEGRYAVSLTDHPVRAA
jgi:hypothetical protein